MAAKFLAVFFCGKTMDAKQRENTKKTIEMGVLNRKNVLGELGERCAYCSGYGFTNGIDGSSKGCHRCDQTGIEPINTRELKEEVDNIKATLAEILILIKNK